MNSSGQYWVFSPVGCPIRKSTDQRLLAASRGLSQLAASFIACWHQGIHRIALSSLITKVNLLPVSGPCGLDTFFKKTQRIVLFTPLFLYLCVVVKEHQAVLPDPKVFSPDRSFEQLQNSCLSPCESSLFVSVLLRQGHGGQSRLAGLVGLTGFEPVTLRLSSACSNQLSYRPIID
jgi:hypothetical protein